MDGFECGPRGNDTIVVHSMNHGELFPDFDFDVPASETWYIEDILWFIYSGNGAKINVMDLLMHIYCQRPELGKDTIMWWKYGDDNDSAPDQYWRPKQDQTRIPLFGPCKIYVGIWNGTPYDASAFLRLIVSTWR